MVKKLVFVIEKPEAINAMQEKPELTNYKSRLKSRIIGFFIYSACILAVLVAFFGRGPDGGYRMVFGYTVFSVLTDSMQSEIPQSSLVVVKQTEPAQLTVGDDITYLREDNATVTHRIVSVIENYQGSGLRGFQTKGLENAMPDPEIVYANNVLGKVVYHSTAIGKLLEVIRTNSIYIVLFTAISTALFFSLRIFFSEKA